MRGRGRQGWRSCPQGRITPACAGKSRYDAWFRRAGGDHPRVCGEEQGSLQGAAFDLGSPPRVRGREAAEQIQGNWIRITPACAGKSRCPFWGSQSGSPPRVRGRVILHVQHLLDKRITPACAGKSGNLIVDGVYTEDHPRVCGEEGTCNPDSPQHWGSPPRVRGRERLSYPTAVLAGITPACAGKRVPRPARRVPDQDHPRVCGEEDYTKDGRY